MIKYSNEWIGDIDFVSFLIQKGMMKYIDGVPKRIGKINFTLFELWTEARKDHLNQEEVQEEIECGEALLEEEVKELTEERDQLYKDLEKLEKEKKELEQQISKLE